MNVPEGSRVDAPQAPPLGRRTIRNVSAVYLMTAVGKLMGIVSLLILARLLTPKDFGIVAVASVIIAILALFEDLGLGAALVQWKDSPPTAADSAFWGTIAMRVVLYTILLILAPLTAAFFSEPALLKVIPVAGLGPVIEGIGFTHAILMQKRLEFWRLSMIEAVNIGVGSTVTVILAFMGFSYWSLVFGSLAVAPVQAALYWIYEPWRPSLRAEREDLRKMAGFGTHVVFINSAGFGVKNLDLLSIGKIVGSIGLGFYQMAGRFALFSATTISSPLAQVLFPTYSRIQNEPERVKKAYLRTLFAVSLIAFPVCVGSLVMADLITLYVLGPGWTAVAVPLQVLAIAGLAATVSGPAWNVFLALGHPGYGSRTILIELCLLAVMLVPFTYYWGLAGAAVAVTVANVVGAFYQLTIVSDLLALRRKDITPVMGPPAVSSLLMGVLLIAARSFIGTSFASFAVLMTIGGVSFLLASDFNSKGRMMTEIREVVRALRKRSA